MLSLFNKCLKKFYNYIDAIINTECTQEKDKGNKKFIMDNMIYAD